MTIKTIVLCLLCSLMLACGQLLFKEAAGKFSGSTFWKDICFEAVSNLWLISALLLYGVTTVLWVYVLRITPLSTAYLFTAVSYAIVPIVGMAYFKETLTTQTWLGMGLIIIGISIIGSNK